MRQPAKVPTAAELQDILNKVKEISGGPLLGSQQGQAGAGLSNIPPYDSRGGNYRNPQSSANTQPSGSRGSGYKDAQGSSNFAAGSARYDYGAGSGSSTGPSRGMPQSANKRVESSSREMDVSNYSQPEVIDYGHSKPKFGSEKKNQNPQTLDYDHNKPKFGGDQKNQNQQTLDYDQNKPKFGGDKKNKTPVTQKKTQQPDPSRKKADRFDLDYYMGTVKRKEEFEDDQQEEEEQEEEAHWGYTNFAYRKSKNEFYVHDRNPNPYGEKTVEYQTRLQNKGGRSMMQNNPKVLDYELDEYVEPMGKSYMAWEAGNERTGTKRPGGPQGKEGSAAKKGKTDSTIQGMTEIVASKCIANVKVTDQ